MLPGCNSIIQNRGFYFNTHRLTSIQPRDYRVVFLYIQKVAILLSIATFLNIFISNSSLNPLRAVGDAFRVILLKKHKPQYNTRQGDDDCPRRKEAAVAVYVASHPVTEFSHILPIVERRKNTVCATQFQFTFAHGKLK